MNGELSSCKTIFICVVVRSAHRCINSAATGLVNMDNGQNRHQLARTKTDAPDDGHEVPVPLEILLNEIRERALEHFLNAVEAAPGGDFPRVLEVEEKGQLRGSWDIPRKLACDRTVKTRQHLDNA